MHLKLKGATISLYSNSGSRPKHRVEKLASFTIHRVQQIQKIIFGSSLSRQKSANKTFLTTSETHKIC